MEASDAPAPNGLDCRGLLGGDLKKASSGARRDGSGRTRSEALRLCDADGIEECVAYGQVDVEAASCDQELRKFRGTGVIEHGPLLTPSWLLIPAPPRLFPANR